MTRIVFFAAAFTAGCEPDESLTAYAPNNAIYQLTHTNGAPVMASTTIDIGTPGQISGSAPCNSYTAPQIAPYPWFETGPIATTRSSCPDLAAEMAYIAALSNMTLAEIAGGVLVLSNTDGQALVFQALP